MMAEDEQPLDRRQSRTLGLFLKGGLSSSSESSSDGRVVRAGVIAPLAAKGKEGEMQERRVRECASRRTDAQAACHIAAEGSFIDYLKAAEMYDW